MSAVGFRSDARSGNAGRTCPELQRARGELVIGWKRRDDGTVLARLRQAGCLKARFPAPCGDGAAEAVTVNVSGGIAAGDVLSTEIDAQEGTRVTLASQAAERLYRSLPASAPAKVRNRMLVGSDALVEWLPQETILFNESALDRVLDVDMAEDASVLCVESLVFGRAAMGEQVRRVSVRDVIRLRRNGRLVFHDAIRLDGDAVRLMARPAIGGGNRAVAALVHAAPDAELRRDSIRDALASAPAECGASGWDGMLVARIIAEDGARLRAGIVMALSALRDGRALPRSWMC
jgi:urease accessory protein